MKGKGLTMDVIVTAALELVEEKGYNNFSVRELAMRLHVKAASLYNHIASVADINRAVGVHAANKLNETLERAAAGKQGREALSALAHEYRAFVKNNYELYRAVMGLPALNGDPSLVQVGRDSLMVIAEVVKEYGIPFPQSVNYSRCFRAAVHGFVSFEMAGYFTGNRVLAEDSFEFLIQGYMEWADRLAASAGKEAPKEE